MAKRQKQEPAEQLLPAGALDVVREGEGLLGFLGDLVGFFTTATRMEQDALARVQRVQGLAVPHDLKSVQAMQQEVRDARTARKEVEDHWAFTAAVSRFHKKLTAKRAMATHPLELAEAHATRLVHTYEQNERRRAADEQRRLQAEADERAAKEKQQQAEDYEKAAVAAEEASPQLSAREVAFVTFYMAGTRPEVAAMQAGFKNSAMAAARLIASDKIRTAIEARKNAELIRQRAAVVADLPPMSDDVEVLPQISSTTRYTYTGECIDLELLRSAVLRGEAPADLLIVDRVKLNDYARSLRERIEMWPGVVLHKKPTVL